MALGRRKKERQQEMWIETSALPRSDGHVFYCKLNQLLAEADFDPFVESLCEEHYHATMGRPGIPPGRYFRMLLVGYFEGIGSQRGIAWRCADSLSLREFLAVPLSEDTPDHSSLTRVRDRLPLEVHAAVFQFVLQLAEEKCLLQGKTVAVDATTLEANAAMKSIVRRDTGEDWQEYLKRLMLDAGECLTQARSKRGTNRRPKSSLASIESARTRRFPTPIGVAKRIRTAASRK